MGVEKSVTVCFIFPYSENVHISLCLESMCLPLWYSCSKIGMNQVQKWLSLQIWNIYKMTKSKEGKKRNSLTTEAEATKSMH